MKSSASESTVLVRDNSCGPDLFTFEGSPLADMTACFDISAIANSSPYKCLRCTVCKNLSGDTLDKTCLTDASTQLQTVL